MAEIRRNNKQSYHLSFHLLSLVKENNLFQKICPAFILKIVKQEWLWISADMYMNINPEVNHNFQVCLFKINIESILILRKDYHKYSDAPFLFFNFWPHSQHMEISWPGIKSEPQLQPMPQPWQCWIINLLFWARDQTCTSAATRATTETTPDPQPTAPQWKLPLVALFY